jgi:hypothetical protein
MIHPFTDFQMSLISSRILHNLTQNKVLVCNFSTGAEKYSNLGLGLLCVGLFHNISIVACFLRGAAQAQLESFHETAYLPRLKRNRLIPTAHRSAERVRGCPLSAGEELGL